MGLGKIGSVHATNLATRVPNATLEGVHDVDELRGRTVAEGLSTTWFETAEELIANDAVEAILIATPAPTHADLIFKAVDAGKHVICEKPLTDTLAAADKVVAAVKDARVHLQVGFQRRFDPNYAKAALLLHSGQLGEPRMYFSSMRDKEPGAASPSLSSFVRDACVHEFDAARWLIGEVDEVTVVGQSLDGSPASPNNVANVVTIIRFQNGALGVIDNGRVAAYGFECRSEIVGTTGTVRVSHDAHGNVEWLRQGEASTAYPADFIERFAVAYVNELVAFCDSILNDTVARPTAIDGHTALMLTLAAEESLRSNFPVSLRRYGSDDQPRYEIAP